eukprot:3820281-Rhodomonas_salina.1
MHRLKLFQGAEVTIDIHHLFVNDFLVHSHRRPFYSICLSGGYRHHVFQIGKPANGEPGVDWYQCRRQPKGAFSERSLASVAPEPLLDTYFRVGDVYLLHPAAYHQVDEVKTDVQLGCNHDFNGPVTLVIKSTEEA